VSNELPNQEQELQGGTASAWADAAERTMELSDATHDLLTRLDSELTYWDANAITFASFRDVVLLAGALPALAEHIDITELGTILTSLLPFNVSEEEMLAEHMRPEMPSDTWYERASSQEILLLDRWRRWLTEHFDEDRIGDPSNNGRKLVETLDRLARAIGTGVTAE
jgi:hypothetical protein